MFRIGFKYSRIINLSIASEWFRKKSTYKNTQIYMRDYLYVYIYMNLYTKANMAKH